MTQKKLEIIAPYTPEHEGPFCTRDGLSVRILTLTDGSNEYPIVGYVGTDNTPTTWTTRGHIIEGCGGSDPDDLMNAREVPVVREFWDIIGRGTGALHSRHLSMDGALGIWRQSGSPSNFEIIHVREVLPGESA